MHKFAMNSRRRASVQPLVRWRRENWSSALSQRISAPPSKIALACSFPPTPRRAAHPASRSSARQSAGERRKIEGTEAVMREPTDIGFEELAKIVYAVFQHGNAIDAHSPGES